MKDKIVQFIKDKDGIVGCLLAIRTAEGIKVGWSRFNRDAEEGNFNSLKAEGLARSKAIKSFLYTVFIGYSEHFENKIEIKVPNFPPSMNKNVQKFLWTVERYFRIKKFEIANLSFVVKSKNLHY